MLKKTFVPAVFAGILSIFSIVSCDVGLGETVDVTDPAVSITYPPASVAIRENFTLAGTCSDDKGVAAVKVTVTNSETNEEIGTFDAVIGEKNSWSLNVNAKKEDGSYPLVDGKYTFDAIAVDTSGKKSGKSSRGFEIDNTAPVFIIKNPGSVDSANPSAFGSIFKIAGIIADDHDIDEMSVAVYKDGNISETPDEILIENNINTAGGTEVTFARYNPKAALSPSDALYELPDLLHQNYLAIYGDEGGTKKFSTVVSVKDSAGVWRNPKNSSADSIGNETTGLYLNDDVYTELMSRTSVYGQLTATDFKKILNGTYVPKKEESRAMANSVTEAQVEAIKEKLAASINDTKEKHLAFTLNKDANPTYSITGFSFKADSVENFGKRKAAKEGTLTFRGLAGLDGTNFLPNKIKIYMFGPYDSGFTAESMKGRLESIYSNPQLYYENQIKEGEEAAGEGATEELIQAYAKAQILADLSEKADTKNLSSTDDLTYSIELPSVITKGKYYVIAASGVDMDSLSFINESYFGFVGESAGTPPTVSITGFDDNSVVSDISKINLSGTVSSDETEIASVAYKVTVTDELNKSAAVGTKTADAEMTLVGEGLTGSWNVALDEYLPADGSMYKYVLNVTAKDSTGLATTETRTFTIDKKSPVLKINSITPIAKTEKVESEESEKVYVNGTITFSANVTDSNLTNVKVTAASDGSEPKEIYSGETSFIEEKVDTTAYTDEASLTFTVTGTDKAGNKTTSTKTVYVSQKTDIPEISSGNAKNSSEIKSYEEVTNGNNVFGITNNNSIAFVLKDDDGIKDVVLTLRNEANKLIKVDPDTKLAVELAEDAVYTEKLSLNGATSYSFNFALPQQEGKFTIEISATDVNYDSTEKAEVKKNRTNNAKFFLKVDENNMVIAFEGNSIINGVCEAKGGVDQTINGTLSITSLDKVKKIERFPMTFSATEKSWVAGSAEAQYPKDTTEGSTKAEISAEISNGKLHWVDKIATGSTSAEKRYLYKATSVTDSSASIELICNVDANAPTLTYYDWKDGWSTASSVKLTVIAGDNAGAYNSGVSAVTYTYNSTTADLAPGAVCTSEGIETGEGEKKFRKYSSIISFADDANSISFTATDKAGNSYNVTVPSVYVDTKAPTDLKGGEYITANLVKNKSQTVAISYNWTDANESKAVSGIKEIIFDTNNNFNINKQTVSGTELMNGTESFNPKRYKSALSGTLNFSLSGLADGEYTIYMKAVDYAGNESAIVSVGKVVVDSTAPSVNYSNITYSTGTTTGTASSGKKINKIVTLSGQVVDNNFVSEGSLPVLYYYDSTTQAWKNVTELNSSAVSEVKRTDNNWSFDFDTTKVSSLAGEKYYQIVVVDAAGNSSLNSAAPTETSYKLIIDQNSDRPTIKFSNIKRTGSVIKTDSVVGTVNDDDGDVKGIWKIDSATFDGMATKTYPALETNNGWTKLKLEGVSWSVAASNTNSWYFYVLDHEGTGFYTKGENSSDRPYVQGVGDTSAVDNSAAVTFIVDQTPPAVSVYVANSALAADAEKGWSSVGGTFSGTKDSGYEKVYLKVVATEGVGMEMIGSDYVLPAITFNSTPVAVTKNSVVKNGNTYTYLLNPIDLSSSTFSGYAEGQIQVVAALSDNSGNPGQGGLSIILDKDAPEVRIISPTTNVSDAVTSSITVKGVVTDSHSSIKKLEWAIPLKGEPDVSKYAWTTIAANASWEINFASGAAESTDSLLYYVSAKTAGSTDKYAISPTSTQNIYQVPIYFRATDSVGNVAVRTSYVDSSTAETKPLYVLVDADGGKPKAWINTPEAGKTTNGLVTIYGGASDDVSVAKVQLKINGSSTLVEASGTNSWKYSIDTSVEGSTCTRNGKLAIAVQVRAIDDNGESQVRDWTEEHVIYIDAQVPVIENLKLVQFGKTVTPVLGTAPITEREYEAGMFLSNKSVADNGSWYLTGDVRDNAAVSKITAVSLSSETTNVIDLPTGADKSLLEKAVPNASINGYKLLVPVTTSEAGMIYAKITAYDNSNGETSETIKINIDSSAPSLYNTSNSETTDAFTSANLRLKAQSQVLGSGLDGTKTVVNSNSFFTFGDYVSEAGSGLDFIAFYYEREKSDGSAKRVYNPMFASSNRTNLAATASNGSVYINADNLPALVITASSRTDAGKITSTYLVNNNNVRAGGLIKIGGSYSKITEVDKASGTVTFTPEVSTSFTTAEIVYAQVVDHQITESWDESTSNVVNDDGDGMIETITQIGATYNWSASINSNNIPDGPVTVTVVAADKAGNISCGKISTKVENNRPRLTKVMLGTDLNGNGKYDLKATSAPIVSVDSEKATADGKSYGEFSYYSAFNKQTGLGQYDVELASGDFKVISGLMIVPEFTGGNGNLKYVLTHGEKATGPETSASPIQMATRSDLETLITNHDKPMFGDSQTAAQNVISFKDYDFGGLSLGSDHDAFKTDKKTYLNLTFWDATEETTQGTDSQWALLKIPVTVKSNDPVPPVAQIRPFYWNGNSENSVYKDSKGVLQGHIELENGLTSSITEKLGSDDPKVSGKIVIEGIVTDDVRLSAITANVFGNSGTVGNYSNGTWVENSPLPTGVVSFSATDLDMSQNGHTVKYSMVVDTEKLTGAAGKDKVITVGATDWKNNGSAADSTQTASAKIKVNEVEYPTGETSYYKMDVVPYITQVWTGLSEYERTYASMHNRASTGEYPVRVGETVELYGWNFGSSVNVTVGESSAVTLTAAVKSNENVKQGTKYVSLPISGSCSSGKVNLTVGSVSALNNLNDNNAHGAAAAITETTESEKASADYSNYYNRIPNSQNNNILSDDVSFDVWDFKTAVTPVGTKANYVNMKVGPYISGNSNSGRIGFSFKNGSTCFNMPGYMNGVGSGILLKIADGYIDASQKIYTWSPSLTSGWPGDIIKSRWTNDNDGYWCLDVVGFSSIKYKMSGTITDNSDKEEITSSGIWIYSKTNGKFVRQGDYPSTTENPIFSQTKMGENYQGFSYNTFAFDANAETYGAALCSDTSGKDYISASLQFFSRQNGHSDNSLNRNYYNSNNARRIENTTFYKTDNPTYGTDKPDYDDERTQSLSMATYTDSSNTYVYMGYYDHGLNRITFRVGSVGKASANDINLGLQDLVGSTGYENVGTSGDGYKIGYYGSTVGDNTKMRHRNSTQSTYVGDKGNAYKYVNALAPITGSTASVAVGAMNDGTAVIAWFDSGKRQLCYTTVPFATLTSTTGFNGYNLGSTLVTSNGGANVAMAIDADNGIHLAYSSNSGSDLYYAYKASGDTSFTEMLVDSKNDVGSFCSIDVGRKTTSGPWIPYITYKSNEATQTKIAYPVSFNSNNRPTAGATSGGFFTGSWAVSMLPAETVSISDKINVGIVKDWANGLIYEFESGWDSTESVTTSATYNICDSTINKGNGTSNPVVGYAIATGSIEMAQKK